ncbi:LLM class flavin-dependent oxidoreductase [Pseudonocardia halophobica]|uniref:LLM class flavin-dependent oxidoreductase n=1 Tax=Pseudonocardia halophobica TaxID=29401 RepID=UPI003D94352D
MKIGLHLADLTWAGGPATFADDLTRVAAEAEDAGFDRISVMDHVWQIVAHGPPEHDMLEVYTLLGYLAARTARVEGVVCAWTDRVTPSSTDTAGTPTTGMTCGTAEVTADRQRPTPAIASFQSAGSGFDPLGAHPI